MRYLTHCRLIEMGTVIRMLSLNKEKTGFIKETEKTGERKNPQKA